MTKGEVCVFRSPRGNHAAPIMRAQAWSRRQESNPQPTAYKAVALPIELRRPAQRRLAEALFSGCGAHITELTRPAPSSLAHRNVFSFHVLQVPRSPREVGRNALRIVIDATGGEDNLEY
jgi:hypothetical protein